MYSHHHLRSLARRFSGSSEKGVAMCEENVEAHAAIPKYIRKIKKRNVLRWEMLKGALSRRGWTFLVFLFWGKSFFRCWNNLWAEKSPMKWVERGLIRIESYIKYIRSFSQPSHEPQASKSFLGRDLCLDTFYTFYVSLLSRKSVSGWLQQIKFSTHNNSFPTPLVAFMSHISHFLLFLASPIFRRAKKFATFHWLRHARICQCAEKRNFYVNSKWKARCFWGRKKREKTEKKSNKNGGKCCRLLEESNLSYNLSKFFLTNCRSPLHLLKVKCCSANNF